MFSYCETAAALARTMLRLSVLVCVLIELIRVRSAIPTEPPESFAERLDRLVEKVERFTVTPTKSTGRMNKHYSKLDQLNSLQPEKYEWTTYGLTDEEEALLSSMQQWAAISPEQLGGLVKDLHEMRHQTQVLRDKLVEDEADDNWDEDFRETQDVEEANYAMDVGDDGWDGDDDQPEPRGKAKPLAQSRLSPAPTSSLMSAAALRQGLAAVSISANVDPILATNERPRILDDSSMPQLEKLALKRAALTNMGIVLREAKCLKPQARWLTVRQLAPAADSIYMPPCVELHRCAPDSGCCDNEAEVCSPIEGKYVAIPLFIKKSDGNLTVSRMLFYNHTTCACLPRDAQDNGSADVSQEVVSLTEAPYNDSSSEEKKETSTSTTSTSENVYRVVPDARVGVRGTSISGDVANVGEVAPPAVTASPKGNATLYWEASSSSIAVVDLETSSPHTLEQSMESDDQPAAIVTYPPELRRCTCPALFHGRILDNGMCLCVCDWQELYRRRDCLSLARGREHFGLRDRICIARGDCTTPVCEHGSYDRYAGRCPLRKYRRRYPSKVPRRNVSVKAE